MNLKKLTGNILIINVFAAAAYYFPVILIHILFPRGFSPFWPSAGIAAYFAVVYKKRAIPGIFAGSIIGNLTLGWSLPVLIIVGIGNTLGPVLTSYILQSKKIGWKNFEDLKQILFFILIMVIFNPFITSSFGAFAYPSFSGYFYNDLVLNWFLSDAAGIITLTPVLYLWHINYRIKIDLKYFKIFFIFTAFYILIISFLYLFFFQITSIDRGVMLLCLVLPIFLLSLKFDQRDVFALNFLIFYSFLYLMLWKTTNMQDFIRLNFFSHMQLAAIITSSMVIIFTAIVKERNSALEKLQYLNKNLEEEIDLKTHRLEESELIFKGLADKAPVGILIYQETFKYANKFAIDIFEYSEDEFYKLAPQDIISDEREKEFVTQKTKEKIAGKAFDGIYTFNIKTHTGKKYIFNFFTTTIIYHDRVAGLAVFIDDTEKKKLADNLKESELFFRTMSENMESGLVLYDEKIIYANPAAVKITEYDKDMLLSVNVWDIFTKDYTDTIKTNLKRRLKGELFTSTFSMKLVTQDGKTKTVMLKNSTVNYKGKWCGIATFIDISEIEDLKSNFVSLVSHEIRTPLASITGFAKLIDKKLKNIKDEQTSLKFKELYNDIPAYLKIIFSEGNRLGSLVNDILDINKIESGKMEWNDDEISNAEDLINQSAASVYSLFKDNDRVSLSIDTSNGLKNTAIKADREKIMQVIINLLSNAFKFTEKGAVTLKTEKDGINLKISVIDTGLGIPQDELNSIFDKFKQLSNKQMTDKPKGTGLGLYICRQIVEHYGGKIWAESRIGKGSVFSFILPVIFNENWENIDQDLINVIL